MISEPPRGGQQLHTTTTMQAPAHQRAASPRMTSEPLRGVQQISPAFVGQRSSAWKSLDRSAPPSQHSSVQAPVAVPVSAADWELNASNRSLMTPSSGAASPRPAVYPMPLGQMQTRLPPGGLQRARGPQQPPPQTLSAFPRSDSMRVSEGAADTVLRSMDSIRRAEGAAGNMPNGAALRRTPSQESSRQRPYAIVPSVTISNSASLQAPMKPSSTRLQAREGVGCLDDPSTKSQLLQMMGGSTYGPTKSASTER